MKKYIKTFLIFSFMLTSTIVLAFPPDVPNDADPPAPISDYVLLLIALGIGLAFWIYSKKEIKA